MENAQGCLGQEYDLPPDCGGASPGALCGLSDLGTELPSSFFPLGE